MSNHSVTVRGPSVSLEIQGEWLVRPKPSMTNLEIDEVMKKNSVGVNGFDGDSTPVGARPWLDTDKPEKP